MARWIIAAVLQAACLCLVERSTAGAEVAIPPVPSEAVATSLPDWLRHALPKSCDGDPAKVVALFIGEGIMTTGGAAGKPLPPGATADLAWLKHFPHIKNLTLSGEFVTDTSLAHVGYLAELERLDVSGSILSGEGFVHLAKLDKLKDLSIMGWRPSEKGFASLTSLKNVESLLINMYRVPDGWVARLGDMKNLRRLLVGGGFKPTRDNMAGLQALGHIQKMELLVGMAADDTVLGGLGKIQNLSMLGLHGATITDAGLAQLEGLSHLENLDLRETKISDAGLAHVGRMTSLKILCLNSTSITGRGLSHLASLSALEELDLGGIRIGDEGLAHLVGLKHLRDLDLSGTRVTEAGLVHLKGITSLRRLAVWTDYLSDDDIIVTVMDKDRVKKMLGHIDGLRIEFWSRWEDEQFGRWSPKGGAAPVLKPTEVSPDHKVSKWTLE